MGLTPNRRELLVTSASFAALATPFLTSIAKAQGAETMELKPGRNAVEYLSQTEKVAANLCLPDDYTPGEKRPAVIINPPASGVKEQTVGVYAEAMAKRGFAALAFDPREFGESEGIRQLQDGFRVADDIKNGLSYLGSLDAVDPDKLFVIGVCAGAGYAAFATAFDARVKALGIVSPYLTSQEEFLQLVGGSGPLRAALLPAAAAAEQKFFETGENTMTRVVPVTDEEVARGRGIALGMRDYYLDGLPGDVPGWRNELSLLSTKPVLAFNIFNYTHMFDAVPTFMAYGDEAVSAEGATRFFSEINGEKEVLKLANAGHFDLYYKSREVEPSADGMAAWFKAHL
ncbi:MAG: alpha/beta hydrolase [Pseudomonadota bacterium]